MNCNEEEEEEKKTKKLIFFYLPSQKVARAQDHGYGCQQRLQALVDAVFAYLAVTEVQEKKEGQKCSLEGCLVV